MRGSCPRAPLCVWSALIAAAVLELAGSVHAAAAQQQKEVLVLYSTRRDAQIALVGDRELPRILEQGLERQLDYYSEFIDRDRVPDQLYKQRFRDFLRAKYRERRFDVIIAMSDVALDFVGESRNELFPDVPIIFFSSSSASRRIPNSTGIFAPMDVRGTAELAKALQPDLQHLFVVSGGDAADRRFENLARSQLQRFERTLSLTYLSGLATSDLEARLGALPPHSAVYYLLVSRDGAGGNVHPLEYLGRVTAAANAPVYSWVDSAMGRGIVGGRLKNQTTQSDAIARLALRVLGGERADDIPMSSPRVDFTEVDWRELRRWGISSARVPAGSYIRFQEASAWDRYGAYILGALVLLLAQSTLIARLLVQRARRRQAEEKARRSEADLRTSYDRIRDLGGRLLSAQETERARIARELHDDISQQMAVLTMDLTLLGNGRQPRAEELAREALTRAHEIARGVHDLSHRLHPARLRLVGLVPALSALQRELSQPGMTISFTQANVPPGLPADLTLCVFRVVQEALQNALKYSHARAVSVALQGTPEGLTLNIADDGVGFDVDAAWGLGLGLISMRERLEAAGGTLEICSHAGGGTRMDVRVPFVAAHQEMASV